MSKIDDYAEYKIIIKNNSNEDLELNINNPSDSEYLKYTITPEDGNNKVLKGSEKTVLLKVEYIKTVPSSSYSSSGEFNDNLDFAVKVINSKSNPKTGRNTWLIVLPIILLLLGLYTMKDQKKLTNPYLFIIGIILLIPYVVKADNCELSIHSNITLTNYQYVYTLGDIENRLYIGDRIPSFIRTFDSEEEIIENQDPPGFLKYKLVDGIITETWVGYRVTEKSKVYYIQGTTNSNDSSASAMFNSNKKTLKDSFGEELCADDSDYYYCEDNTHVATSIDGHAYLRLGDFYCIINYESGSLCDMSK